MFWTYVFGFSVEQDGLPPYPPELSSYGQNREMTAHFNPEAITNWPVNCMAQPKTTDKYPITKNNEFEFTKLTTYQNDEPTQNWFYLNYCQAKRALAGFAIQIQNMPFTGCFEQAKPADLGFVFWSFGLR